MQSASVANAGGVGQSACVSASLRTGVVRGDRCCATLLLLGA
jgi:hypothetical protein